MDRDAALLAATFAEREDVMEDVEVGTRLDNLANSIFMTKHLHWTF